MLTIALVKAAIKKLKLLGAGGPHGLPVRHFKTLSDSLAQPLPLMFTSFMPIGN